MTKPKINPDEVIATILDRFTIWNANRPERMRRCIICTHPEVREINRSLLEGTRTRKQLHDTIRVDWRTLNDHINIHLSEGGGPGTRELLMRYVTFPINASPDKQYRFLIGDLCSLRDKANEKGDVKEVLKLTREIRTTCKLLESARIKRKPPKEKTGDPLGDALSPEQREEMKKIGARNLEEMNGGSKAS